MPDGEKRDISDVLAKKSKTNDDYKFLFSQTGLGKSAIEELMAEGKTDEIYEFSEQYFAPCDYDTEYIAFPFVATEVKTSRPTKIVPLKRGDVLVSLTTRAMGYRHGHAGMVLDDETGKTLEHMVIGETSAYGRTYSWKYYPTFAVLRHKNPQIALKAAEYAEENLIGISYNPFAGIIKKDKQDENPISSSQCAHLIWQAYKVVGADIDGDGGFMVLPGDFLKCEDFEIVQIYGINPYR